LSGSDGWLEHSYKVRVLKTETNIKFRQYSYLYVIDGMHTQAFVQNFNHLLEITRPAKMDAPQNYFFSSQNSIGNKLR